MSLLSAKLALKRAAGLPRQAYGSALAHAGLGLTVIGIAATAWHAETITLMHVGEARKVGGYALTLTSLSPRQGPNYRETAANFSIASRSTPGRGGFDEAHLHGARTPTTQVGLMTTGFGQIYASLGDSEPDGRVGVRLYWKPLVLFIWLGAVVMALGGALVALRSPVAPRRRGKSAARSRDTARRPGRVAGPVGFDASIMARLA